jgi:hypothetical protein
MRAKQRRKLLIPDDPRHVDHPCHQDQWLQLARALGRTLADRDFNREHGAKGNERGSELRKNRK